MVVEKIFWLDDYPLSVCSVAQELRKLEQPMEKLFDKTTFVFDYEMGKEIVAVNQFDLYVLNCDFPNKNGYSERYKMKRFIESIKEGSWQIPEKSRFYKDVAINFVKFYENELKGYVSEDARFVVMSNSHDAPVHACIHKMELYSRKGEFSDGDVSKLVDESWRFNMLGNGKKLDPTGFKTGSFEDFVKEYLL